MCGIYGFVGFSNTELLKQMGNALSHRGPDQVGHFISKQVSLGMNRLAIIDTSCIQIPLINEKRTILLTFNGEIYNYKSLRDGLETKGHRFATNTDSEVLVHLYEEYGEGCLEKLNGMFAFAIWDSENQRLFMARDRLGIKPLFYHLSGNKLVFASEINALLAVVQPEISLGAMGRFLTYRYNFGAQTLFKGIRRLEPGTYATFQGGHLDIKSYWKPVPKKVKDPLRELAMLLSDSVRMRLQSDVKWGVFLSGGLDSSAITYYVRQYARDVTTFSLDYEENQNAIIASKALKTKHFALRYNRSSIRLLPAIIKQFGEPLADPIAIPTYLIAKEARKHCTVVLSGEGADEVFGGYEQYKIMRLAMAYHSTIPRPLRFLNSQILRLFPESFREFHESLVTPEEAYKVLVSQLSPEAKILANVNHNNTPNIFTGRSLQSNMQYFDLKRFLPEDNLFRLDMMLMANSMEGRVPFLDHRIVELGFGLPDELRHDKRLLRELVRGKLPAQILNAKKKRWIFPTDEWFPMDAFRRIFNDPDLQKYFNMKPLFKLLNYKSSLKHWLLSLNPLTKLYYSRQLWNLLCFGVWFKLFIKGEEVKI